MGCAPASGLARALILHAVRTPSQSARRKHGRDRNSTHRDEASPLVSSANWEDASHPREQGSVTKGDNATGPWCRRPQPAAGEHNGERPERRNSKPRHGAASWQRRRRHRQGLLCLHHRAECDQRHRQGNGGNAVRQCRHTIDQVARASPSPYGEVMSDFYVCKSLIRTLWPRAGKSRQTLVSLLVSD